MRPRAEREIFVDHTRSGAAYKMYLPKIKKIVGSNDVAFDDIPTETSFMHEEQDN